MRGITRAAGGLSHILDGYAEPSRGTRASLDHKARATSGFKSPTSRDVGDSHGGYDADRGITDAHCGYSDPSWGFTASSCGFTAAWRGVRRSQGGGISPVSSDLSSKEGTRSSITGYLPLTRGLRRFLECGAHERSRLAELRVGHVRRGSQSQRVPTIISPHILLPQRLLNLSRACHRNCQE